MNALRGFTGLVAGGLVALLLGLLAALAIAHGQGAPGPGPVLLGSHAVAAAVAVPAQRYADRHAGGRGLLAALLVLALGAGVVVFFWVL